MSVIEEIVSTIRLAADGVVETVKSEGVELQDTAKVYANTAKKLAQDTMDGKISPVQAMSAFRAMKSGAELTLLAEQFTVQREARKAWATALDIGFTALSLLK